MSWLIGVNDNLYHTLLISIIMYILVFSLVTIYSTPNIIPLSIQIPTKNLDISVPILWLTKFFISLYVNLFNEVAEANNLGSILIALSGTLTNREDIPLHSRFYLWSLVTNSAVGILVQATFDAFLTLAWVCFPNYDLEFISFMCFGHKSIWTIQIRIS